jgi:hypothetical protein
MAIASWRKGTRSVTVSAAAILGIAVCVAGCAGVVQQPAGSSQANSTVSSIAVSPNTTAIQSSGTAQFSVAVQGTTSNKSVTWKASAGNVTEAGLYTAPSAAGAATVTATSNADSTKSASATVTVTATASGAPPGPSSPVPVIGDLSAAPSTIQEGQSTSLQWSVTGATSLELGGVGAVSGSGVKVTPSETTTYTLVATNASGSASKSVLITVLQGTALGSATVDATKPGIEIPATFMGFSHELGFSIPEQLMGLPGQTNPIYRQLVKNLLAYGAGPLVIRMGGNSADTSGEPTASTVGPMAEVAKDTGAKFTLGVNLGSDNVQLAVDQARNYASNMPPGSLEAIEIGNEPDLYSKNGLRSSSYTFSGYFADFAKWRTQISPVLPQGIKLMGPSWGSTGSLPNLPAFLTQEQHSLSLVSQHNYAGSACRGETNPSNYLLQPSAATKTAHTVAPRVLLTHQAGLPFRMGEMNSISCSGETGVSDIFASALWSIDVLFEFANIGIDGVNFHTANSGAYALFTFNSGTSGGSTTFSVQSIRPEYYGLLFFQQATANHAKLLPVTLTTQANLKAWATLDNNGVVRVILINKDETAQGLISIALSGFGSGVVTRLNASNYQATSGITVGGQTFDGSTDGKLRGTPYSETAVAVGGVYSVALPPTSAALLTIQP